MSRNYRRESITKITKPTEQPEKIGVNITVDGKVELRFDNKVVARLEIQAIPPVTLEARPTLKRDNTLNQSAG